MFPSGRTQRDLELEKLDIYIYIKILQCLLFFLYLSLSIVHLRVEFSDAEISTVGCVLFKYSCCNGISTECALTLSIDFVQRKVSPNI